ncbi:MAG TPA: glycosyltransferase family 39 protein [Oligoflexia bacterium]|nr:glycosyltransferase family 39 protein [Oligoflexia bacterium]
MLRLLLVLIVLLPVVPFLNSRVLRMAGDEKVYINQAVEMARSNSWFFQTMADEPSYFKGPLHYIFIRIGMVLFGDSLAAGVWMNALALVIAALAMFKLAHRRWGPRAGFLLGLATALNVGAVSHTFASQMEVELLALTALAISALGLAPEAFAQSGSKSRVSFRSDLFFWLIAGIIGWVKSPLHSVLLGTSAIIYWAFTRQLWPRLKNPKAWACVFVGMAVCVAGYLPAYLGDQEAFMATYLGREQFQKGGNNRAWHYPTLPLIHFLLPWTLIVFAAVGKLLWRATSGKRRFMSMPNQFAIDRRMMLLGAAVSVPTILFWMFWDYKGQNYNLPILPGLLLFGFACFAKAHVEPKPPMLVYRIVSFLCLAALFAFIGLIAHFWPLPEWWNIYWVYATFATMAVFIFCFAYGKTVKTLTIGTVAFFFAFALATTPLGNREMRDVRNYLKENPKTKIYYYNLEPSIWSEWGLLQFTLNRPVFGLHRINQIQEATKPGHTVLVPNAKALATVLAEWKKIHPSAEREPNIRTWKRWLTKGKSPSGEPMWKVAWTKRDLSHLERDFFIVSF